MHEVCCKNGFFFDGACQINYVTNPNYKNLRGYAI